MADLNDIPAFIIFTDGVSYFIPGDEEDCGYADVFDNLASRYFPYFDRSLGAGWIFDKEAIDIIKKDFDVQEAPYAEIKISDITLHCSEYDEQMMQSATKS